MSNVIIDRRQNPGGKNTPNRQKFVKRTREQIRKNIRKDIGDRDISGHQKGQNVKINRKSIHEPELHNDSATGDRDFVLPGNKDFVPGDTINKPKGGQGQGGSEGSDGGQGEDDFDFALSNDEFVDILFEDLELPDMVKKEERNVEYFERQRSGYSNEGNPSQLNLVQSMRNSIGRRIALKKPKQKRIKALEEQIAQETDQAKILLLTEELERLKKRTIRIPFLDPTDLRYNNYSKVPKPRSQAVVFCIMDVSASMTQNYKDLAKRFFMLLNLFISRKYKRVETVFIRHHSVASECTEEEFFYSKETGGTVVSTAYELMYDIMQKRYPPEQWNVYVSQATDGDNFSSDNDKLKSVLEENILPNIQQLSYIHVTSNKQQESYGNTYFGAPSLGWGYVASNELNRMMQDLEQRYGHVVTKQVSDPSDVYPIFRQIFRNKQHG